MQWRGLYDTMREALMWHRMSKVGRRGGGVGVSVPSEASGGGAAASLRTTTAPSYVTATDTILRDDDLQSYADDTAFTAGYGGKYQVKGTVTFQTTGGRSGFPKCVLQDWSQSTTCGTDARVGTFYNPTQAYAPYNTPGFAVVFECWQSFDTGFVSNWLSSPRVNTLCSGTALKGHLVTRDGSAGGRGRLGIYHQYLDWLGEVQDGQNGTIGQPAWEVHSGQLRTDGGGTSKDNNSLYYISNKNNQSHGTDKSPKACYDGQWHFFQQAYIWESANGVGDGFIGVWVDGLPVIYYDGTDASSMASGKVWTRVGNAPDSGSTMGLSAFEVNDTFNSGAPQAQQSHQGGVRAYIKGA